MGMEIYMMGFSKKVSLQDMANIIGKMEIHIKDNSKTVKSKGQGNSKLNFLNKKYIKAHLKMI
jgi:hypothetical protein